MEISELKAFVAVHEQGSFSAAARSIHITQPAISKRVAQLENRLNQSLFDRIGHQITLTEAGERLLPHAQTIINALNNGIHDVSRVSDKPSGILRIATSYHVGLHHLPDSLKRYYNDFPDVELDLRFMDSEDALEAIQQGEIELAIITLPLNLPDHLQAKTLWKDPMQIVCAKDHPLATTENIDDLLSYPAILPDTHTVTRQLVENELSKQGLKINVRLSSNHLESIRMMVEIGLGWSVLPTTLESDQLMPCHFTVISFSRELGIITHERRTLTKAAEMMIERLEGDL